MKHVDGKQKKDGIIVKIRENIARFNPFNRKLEKKRILLD